TKQAFYGLSGTPPCATRLRGLSSCLPAEAGFARSGGGNLEWIPPFGGCSRMRFVPGLREASWSAPRRRGAFDHTTAKSAPESEPTSFATWSVWHIVLRLCARDRRPRLATTTLPS